MEIITCRRDLTGIWQYEFYSRQSHSGQYPVNENGLQIGKASSCYSASSTVRIEGPGITWYSQFNIDTIVIPGTGRRVKNDMDGAEVFRIIWWDNGLYEVRARDGSIRVDIRDGQYRFGLPGMPVTAIAVRNPDYRTEKDPLITTTFYEDVSEAYMMMVLSFPALRFM